MDGWFVLLVVILIVVYVFKASISHSKKKLFGETPEFVEIGETYCLQTSGGSNELNIKLVLPNQYGVVMEKANNCSTDHITIQIGGEGSGVVNDASYTISSQYGNFVPIESDVFDLLGTTFLSSSGVTFEFDGSHLSTYQPFKIYIGSLPIQKTTQSDVLVLSNDFEDVEWRLVPYQN